MSHYRPDRVLASDRIIEMLEDGELDRDNLIMAFLNWLTDEDLKNLAHDNEIDLKLSDD